MITNQPDVSRGKITLKKLVQINNFLSQKLKLDDVFCCIHDDKDFCECRKPNPGMIKQAILKWNIDISKSFLVGDRWKDIEAGKKVNLQTVLIDFDYKEKKVNGDFNCKKFSQAVSIILELNKNKK